jgi:hypothetical protein
MSGALVALLAGMVAGLSGGCTGCGSEPPVADNMTRTVAQCSWSYFGDARAVVFRGRVFTACIGVDGRSILEDYDPVSGRRRVTTIFEPLEVDDHNNPSLVVFRGRLMAFSSPHSGYMYPLNRRSRMDYRTLLDPDTGRWSAVQTVPLGQGCKLGYTYPNPVVAGERLYLFMRGPCWAPYFTWTSDGHGWAPPRTLVKAPPDELRDSRRDHRRVRPYGKYAGTVDGSVLIALSDGHPASFKSSLYFAELRDDTIYGADGRRIASVDDLPLSFDRLDRVQAYSASAGRAWPMDVAAGADGRPVIAYTALHGVQDTFRYATFDGRGWSTQRIARAGHTLFTYHNSGVTLDHADPSRLVLSRTVHGQHEIELRATADRGATWKKSPVTSRSIAFNIRPVIARGGSADAPPIVLWVAGSARSFREYETAVLMRVPSAIHRTWGSTTERCSEDAGSKEPSGKAGWASCTAPGSWDSTASSP